MKTALLPLGLAAAALIGACTPRNVTTPAPESPAMSATQSPPSGKRVVVSGIARDAKAGAVLEFDDGRAVYVSGLSSWPAGVVGRRVRGTGTLVVASRLPRATQDGSGAWSQGVSGESAGETWLDDAHWAVAGADAAPWTVTISDGSGNVTTFSQPREGPATWRYRPVTPAESSSGVYSGGAPATGSLTTAQVEELWQRVLAAKGGPASDGRAKGTFFVEVESPEGRRATVVQRSAAGDLDAWVRALWGQ